MFALLDLAAYPIVSVHLNSLLEHVVASLMLQRILYELYEVLFRCTLNFDAFFCYLLFDIVPLGG
jgi:hypothetical protein